MRVSRVSIHTQLWVLAMTLALSHSHFFGHSLAGAPKRDPSKLIGSMGKITYLVSCWCSLCTNQHLFQSSQEKPHDNDIAGLSVLSVNSSTPDISSKTSNTR